MCDEFRKNIEKFVGTFAYNALQGNYQTVGIGGNPITYHHDRIVECPYETEKLFDKSRELLSDKKVMETLRMYVRGRECEDDSQIDYIRPVLNACLPGIYYHLSPDQQALIESEYYRLLLEEYCKNQYSTCPCGGKEFLSITGSTDNDGLEVSMGEDKQGAAKLDVLGLGEDMTEIDFQICAACGKIKGWVPFKAEDMKNL